MRCHICNAPLGEKEVKYNKDHEEFDPCSKCLDAIAEAFDDPLEEDEFREDYFDDSYELDIEDI